MRTSPKHTYSTPEDLLAQQTRSEVQILNEWAAGREVPIETIRKAQDLARGGGTVCTDKFSVPTEPIQ
jgi:hypothetical protein